MANLKSSLALSVLIIAGCATSSFKVLHHKNSAYEFQVTPDRIILECETVEKDDGDIVYGFMIHVLDVKNSPFTLVQTNVLAKESCDERLEKIGKILKNGKRIYLVGFGDFDSPRKTNLLKYTFPKLGAFEHSGHSFQFIAIRNEFDQCFAAFSGEEKPCPSPPFPAGGWN